MAAQGSSGRPSRRAQEAPLSANSSFEQLRAAVSGITDALHQKLRAAEEAALRAQAAADRVEAQKSDLFRREQELERREWAAWERERHLRLREEGLESTSGKLGSLKASAPQHAPPPTPTRGAAAAGPAAEHMGPDRQRDVGAASDAGGQLPDTAGPCRNSTQSRLHPEVAPETDARLGCQVAIKTEQLDHPLPFEDAQPEPGPTPAIKPQRPRFTPTVPTLRRDGPGSNPPGNEARDSRGSGSSKGRGRQGAKALHGQRESPSSTPAPQGRGGHGSSLAGQETPSARRGGRGEPERGTARISRGRASLRGKNKYTRKWWRASPPVPSPSGGAAPQDPPGASEPPPKPRATIPAPAPSPTLPPPPPLVKAPEASSPEAEAAAPPAAALTVSSPPQPGASSAVLASVLKTEAATGWRAEGIKAEAGPLMSSDSDTDVPLSARRPKREPLAPLAQRKPKRKRGGALGPVTLLEALEEDAPELLELLHTEGLVDDMPLLDLEFDNHRFEGLHRTLASVVRSAPLGANASAADAQNRENQKRYSMAALKCLLQLVRAYSGARPAGNLPDLGYADPSRVTWGWCRELRSFVFVFEAANRIVVEQPEYGKATYFFEMEQNLSTMEQLSRLVSCMSVPEIRRSDILSNDKQVLERLNLTDQQRQALAACGWDGDRGLGSLLNYSERVVHDHSMGAEEWKDKIGKHVSQGALMGRVSKAPPAARHTGQQQQQQPVLHGSSNGVGLQFPRQSEPVGGASQQPPAVVSKPSPLQPHAAAPRGPAAIAIKVEASGQLDALD